MKTKINYGSHLLAGILIIVLPIVSVAQVNSPNGYFNASTSNVPLTLQTNGTSRVTVLGTGSGFVGIGTTAPAEMLHINGSIRGNQSGALRISTGNGYVDIGPQNGSFSHFQTDRPNYYFNRKLFIDEGIVSSYDEPLYLQAAGLTVMTLNESGNVGIGTNSPSNIQGWGRVLDVNGSNHSKILTTTTNEGIRMGMYSHVTGWYGGGGFVGTESSHNLHFLTDYTPKMSIITNGNVGIGTTNPRGKFDVDGPGDIYLSDDINDGASQTLYLPGHIYMSPFPGSNILYLQARRGNSTGTTAIRLRTYNEGSPTDAMHIEGNGNVGIGTTSPAYKLDVAGTINASALYVNGAPFSGSMWTTSGSNIYYNTGNVGIGTSSPAERLHIQGAIRGNAAGGALRVKTENGFLDLGPMDSEWSHIQTDRAKFYFNRPLYVDGAINSYNTNDLVLRTGNEDRITIRQSTGDVGIGTSLASNPNNYKLAVNGKVGAHEVRVEQTSAAWPDYVFSEKYNLPSLADVEKYIDENNHLEEVPSAEEVKENGHDLGSMDAILLKKVEELTLYIIQQEKRMNAQEQELQGLKEKLNLNK